MHIGFVCTNYNNSSYTKAAIASLLAGRRWNDVRAVVVDNGSDANDVASLKEFAQKHPEIELVLSPDNLGYFPGLNLGILALRRRCPDVNHLIVGNNDLVFPADFVCNVQRHSEVFHTWAVVAPDLVTDEGVHQNPHVLHPISRARKWIWDLYFLSYGAACVIRHAARVTKRFTARKEQAPGGELYKTAGPIEQGYGACYLLGPRFFEHFGTLWAPTFMMQEEFFLSEQLKTIGQQPYYDPRFVVYHRGHAATDRLPNRQKWRIAQVAHRHYKRYLAIEPAERSRFVSGGGQRDATCQAPGVSLMTPTCDNRSREQ